MTLTENEKRTVLAVFDSLIRKPYSELNTFLGSRTIQEMGRLFLKMKYDDYCNEHGIAYEDMTEEDFIDEYSSHGFTEEE